MVSPSNFLATNPVVQQRIRETGGRNLVEGFNNLLEDWERVVRGGPPVGAEAFQVGRDVAATPGKTVLHRRLIELIQYAPATRTVRPEPILIVPAWIMKYYILDLSPANSLVRYLTEQGFTVFMISGRTRPTEDRDLGMEDYRRLGVMAALDAIGAIVPDRRSPWGRLLPRRHAALDRGRRHGAGRRQAPEDGDLLAAQVDFREAGELTLFINESRSTSWRT